MDKLQQLSKFIHQMVSDDRLKPIHIALSTALCHALITNEFQQPYPVSRRLLMSASGIRSKATYHKAIRELQLFGYLKYSPSYHPVKGSAVMILIDSNTNANEPHSII